MSDQPEASTALGQELLKLLTVGQVRSLIQLLRQVRAQGYGEITLQIDGNRLFIVKSESFDGGILTKLKE